MTDMNAETTQATATPSPAKGPGAIAKLLQSIPPTFRIAGKVLPAKLVIGVGLAIVLGGGYLALSSSIAAKEERRIRQVLVENDMAKFVRFASLSHSMLSGTTTLNDVTLDFPDNTSAKIAHLDIHKWQMEGAMVTGADVRARDMNFTVKDVYDSSNPLRLARFTDLESFHSDPIGSLLVLGYKEVHLDMSGQFNIALKDGVLTFAFEANGEDIASFSFNGEIHNISEHLIKQLGDNTGSASTAAMTAMGDIYQQMDKMTLASFELEFNDNGYVERAQNYLNAQNADLPDQKSEGLFLYDEKSAERDRKVLEKEGVSASDAEAISDAIARFSKSGSYLKIYTDMSNPLPLSKLIESAMGMSPGRFIVLTGLKVKS